MTPAERLREMTCGGALMLLDNYLDAARTQVKELEKYRALLTESFANEIAEQPSHSLPLPEEVLAWATGSLRNFTSSVRTDLLGKRAVDIVLARQELDKERGKS